MKSFLTFLTTIAVSTTLIAGDNCPLAGSRIVSSSGTSNCPTSGSHVGQRIVHGGPVHTLVAAPAEAATDSASKDIVDTAVAAGSFKTLVAAVKAAGLVDTLKGAGPFTVFAPTDAAFAKLPEGTIVELLKPENKARLQAILTYHVVPGKVQAADVVKLTGAKTVQGQQIDVSVKNNKVSVDGANVVKTDIQTSNGVIHVIDSVLLPSEKDIVQTAADAKTFTTLLAAAKAAGLVEVLQSDGPLTVFAPTDEAFAQLPAGTVADLLKPENKEKLAAILTYHVVPGRVMAADVVEMKSAKTVNGAEISIDASDAGVMINKSKVVAADIEATNGVIHVIDSVLLP